MEQTRTTGELVDEFKALGDFINSSGDPAGALHRIVGLATRSIPGCDWSAVTQAGANPRTLAASDDTAQSIDRVQVESREGPCLSAADEGAVIHVPDLRAEERWPVFVGRALAETPARAVLTFQLDTAGSRSALNLYAGRSQAFGDESLATAALFATHAHLAMLHLNAATKSANLEHALTTSRQIGSAIGILMATHKLTEAQAFDVLRQTSQRLHRKLHDIALEVRDTGAVP